MNGTNPHNMMPIMLTAAKPMMRVYFEFHFSPPMMRRTKANGAMQPRMTDSTVALDRLASRGPKVNKMTQTAHGITRKRASAQDNLVRRLPKNHTGSDSSTAGTAKRSHVLAMTRMNSIIFFLPQRHFFGVPRPAPRVEESPGEVCWTCLSFFMLRISLFPSTLRSKRYSV